MIPALLAMAAVWLVAGWWACRRSRRVARLWAAAALTVLAGTACLTILRLPGPWWPLLERSWSTGEWMAALLWIAALALIWRVREPGRSWGLVTLSAGVAAFTFGLVAGSINHSAHSGRLCLGETASIGSWTATMRRIEPVVAADFTAVRAQLSLRSAAGKTFETRPELRDFRVGTGARHAGAGLMQSWNGELLAEVNSLSENPECAEVTLEWRALGQWLRYGAWLSFAGAALLLAAACRSAWRRIEALERIAMRREDRGRAAAPANRDRLSWQPAALAGAFGLAGLAWQFDQPPLPGPVVGQAADGPALIAARQSLFGGPRLDNRWIVTADALTRHGQFGDAAGMLLGATEPDPGNAEAWLALGDALYAHAGGRLVPAAALAYQRADRAAARLGRPTSLAAEALSRSGRSEQAQRWLNRRLTYRLQTAP